MRTQNALFSERRNNQEGTNQNNPLWSGLNQLLRNADNPQSNDEFEFFDLIRYLLTQINLNNGSLPEPINNSPRISDYLQNLNLINTIGNQSIISDLFSLIFQSLSFDDLLKLINRNFHDYARFKQPFQDFVRNKLLHNMEWTLDNIKSEISNFITSNQDCLITIVV